jgi:5-formyltetrahydrofolate cyclo-ligase
VPGLAFDRWGGRLGRGGGHYDRFLGRLASLARLGTPETTPTTVGVVVDALVSDRPLPSAAHDVAVRLLATESGVGPVLDADAPPAAP